MSRLDDVKLKTSSERIPNSRLSVLKDLPFMAVICDVPSLNRMLFPSLFPSGGRQCARGEGSGYRSGGDRASTLQAAVRAQQLSGLWF